MTNLLSLNGGNQNLQLEEQMLFICPECGQENNTQQGWRTHLNIQHDYCNKTFEDFDFKQIDDTFHECQICMKLVANAHQEIALLQYHRFLHLPFPQTYRCRHCPASFERKRALYEHLFSLHNNIIAKLSEETKIQEIRTSDDIESSMHINDFYMKYLCPLCGKMFDRSSMWQQHIDAAHSATSVDLRMFRIQSTKNYYCAQCSQTIYNDPTKTELQRHNFTHQPNPLYFQCSYCSTKKDYKTELLLHFIKSHKDEFLKFKDYIKKPIEWGGEADKDVIEELDTLLNCETDILRKAIKDSLIELDEETEKESAFHHEFALDQSLQELDEILNSEIDPNLQLKVSKSSTEFEFDDDELEELCCEMFEEIRDQCNNISTEELKPNRKRLKLDLSIPENGLKINDSMQKEMQKYIKYLCPECGEEFQSQSEWRTHVFEQHKLANAVETKFRSVNSKKTAFICLVCYQVQRTTKHSELRRHHFQHMPYQAYLKCAICTKTKSSKPKMLQHLQFSHLKEIQKCTTGTSTKTMIKNLRCLDCDKLYAQPTRFETHCRQCPQRLKPLAVGLYDIEKNMRLIEHLQNASKRIGKLLEEEGIQSSCIKLPYK